MGNESFAHLADCRLCVNVDHIATVREARGTDEPDPVRAAVLAELGGAHGITVHLREDRRHIGDRDVELLMSTVRTFVNLELAVEDEVLGLAEVWAPAQATLVPEKREELTTEGGLDLSLDPNRIKSAIAQLQSVGTRVSLFIDPDPATVTEAASLGANAIELHTGEYANSVDRVTADREIKRLVEAVKAGTKLGLGIHAGHGLTYENVQPVAAITEFEELSIGHSIVSRSVLVGLERAVLEMGQLIREARA